MSTDRLGVGIAGAGLLGRLCAFVLARAGHRVDVFDPAASATPAFDGTGAAAFTAAGMLSPLAELDASSEWVARLGQRSVALWPDLAARLPGLPAPRIDGSVLVAHGGDRGAAERVLARLSRAPAGMARPQPLAGDALRRLEPALAPLPHAWLLPGEGLLDPPATMQALHDAAGPAVHWHWRTPALDVRPGAICMVSGTHRFDLVIDARGTGATPAAGAPAPSIGPAVPIAPAPSATPAGRIVGHVRGVRGETAWLHAPAHGLRRPVRLLHPRHRVYLVPRSPDRIIVGASELESDDRSPVSVRSAVELLAAAHSVMPALAEARIERLDRNLRPALPDNEPAIEHTTDAAGHAACIRINGLFRHGWLLAPALLVDALAGGRAVPWHDDVSFRSWLNDAAPSAPIP